MKTPLCITASAVLASAAWADSFATSSFMDTINVGESTSVTKTLTITPGVSSATLDVFFLFDTTGSMGGAINQAANAASSIFSNTNALGNVNYGVGRYEDYPTSPWGSSSNVPWALVQDLTSDTGSVNSALGSLRANGGADGPESAFDGLVGAADEVSWRAGSKRMLFWFGDARSQDSEAHPGPMETETLAALQGRNIEVNAINYGSLDSLGQASRITADRGGALYGSSSVDDLVDVVKGALDASFSSYANIGLDLSEVPEGLSFSLNPASYSGSWNRDAEETFSFDLTFTGDAPGDYQFDIYGLVDGVRTTLGQHNRIIVGGDIAVIPEPSVSVFGALGLIVGFLGMRRTRPS